MLKRLFLGIALVASTAGLAAAAGDKAKPKSPDHAWHFGGLTGQHDIEQVQRGFQVYWTKCASCHGMEYRRFWHLEKIGYGENLIKAEIIAPYLQGIGETYDPSSYSILSMPVSRAEGAPDLSHVVLARGKTMEAGADYVYSLLIGYDRDKDAVLGQAVQVELNEDAAAFAQVGETQIARYDDGSVKSETTVFEKPNFYLYGEGEDWVLRSYVDIRTDIQDYAADGTPAEPKSILSFRLDETDPKHEKKYAAEHEGYKPSKTAADAWAHRGEAHFHTIAAWADGQYYNPFKAGGVISMRSPLVDLEVGHRTDYSVDELMADVSEFELNTYWLRKNNELQAQILELLPSGADLYQAAIADGTTGENDEADAAYATFAAQVQVLLDQMQPEDKKHLAEDVTAYFAWSSDINMNSRKQVGLWVVLLLGILSILLYFFYREIAKQEFAKQAREGGPWDDSH